MSNITRLVDSLAQLKLTVTAAESLTGGMFQSRLCACEQAAEVYTGGFITYSDEAKATLLDFPRRVIEKHGAVSEQVALAMAKGCRRALQADLGLSFTGVGGPGPAEGEAPGTVWIGVADCDSAFAREYVFEGAPEEVLEQTLETGAGLLADYVLDNRGRLTCNSEKNRRADIAENR